MIKLILSFDHELPLGGVHQSYDQAMFEPTQRVLKAAENENVRVCLFTDILSYLFFKRHNITEFTEAYIRQLQYAVTHGHDVQLHLHPHWMNTRFENGTFVPSSSFALSDFADASYPDNLEGIIEQGIQELTTICRAVKKDYQCLAFRAGGFNLSPETKRILTSLYKNGIRIDSSIPKGFFYKSAFSLISYADMPEACNWYIPLSGPLSAVADDGMYEIPIATIPAGLWTNIKHLYFKRKNKKYAFVAGKSIHSGKVNKWDKIRFVFSVRMLGFDVYSLGVKDLLRMLKYNIVRYKDEQDIILSAISHPKNMGPYGVELMTGFIRAARNKYPGLKFVIHGEVLPTTN